MKLDQFQRLVLESKHRFEQVRATRHVRAYYCKIVNMILKKFKNLKNPISCNNKCDRNAENNNINNMHTLILNTKYSFKQTVSSFVKINDFCLHAGLNVILKEELSD